MRDYLLGYLLDALEPAEAAMVEAELARDPQLKNELAILARGLQPLASDREHCDPPSGLAHRTCEFVTQQARVTLAPAPAAILPGRWNLVDMVVAAGIFLAATMLFFPAVNQSLFTARVNGCQNNLRQIGMALNNYSASYKGTFPIVPLDGQLAAAHCLIEHGLSGESTLYICPGSELANRAAQLRLLTSQELRRMHPNWKSRLHDRLVSSYGYTWGHVLQGVYQPTRNLGRAKFALVADTPNTSAPFRTVNHGGCGQNVLFEDGHVQYLTTCRARGCQDDIFTNDDGEVGPGLHANDSVITPGSFMLLVPVDSDGLIELSR
jgi:hypothetical protein